MTPAAPAASVGQRAGAGDAVVFPGQGSQRFGMGRDFYERSAVAKETFEEACDAAGADLTAICFERTRACT